MGGPKKGKWKKGKEKKENKAKYVSFRGALRWTNGLDWTMVRICSASVMCRSIRVSTTVLLFRVSELGFEARSGLKDGPDRSSREFLGPPSPALTTLLRGREVS